MALEYGQIQFYKSCTKRRSLPAKIAELIFTIGYVKNMGLHVYLFYLQMVVRPALD